MHIHHIFRLWNMGTCTYISMSLHSFFWWQRRKLLNLASLIWLYLSQVGCRSPRETSTPEDVCYFFLHQVFQIFQLLERNHSHIYQQTWIFQGTNTFFLFQPRYLASRFVVSCTTKTTENWRFRHQISVSSPRNIDRFTGGLRIRKSSQKWPASTAIAPLSIRKKSQFSHGLARFWNWRKKQGGFFETEIVANRPMMAVALWCFWKSLKWLNEDQSSLEYGVVSACRHFLWECR